MFSVTLRTRTPARSFKNSINSSGYWKIHCTPVGLWHICAAWSAWTWLTEEYRQLQIRKKDLARFVICQRAAWSSNDRVKSAHMTQTRCHTSLTIRPWWIETSWLHTIVIDLYITVTARRCISISNNPCSWPSNISGTAEALRATHPVCVPPSGPTASKTAPQWTAVSHLQRDFECRRSPATSRWLFVFKDYLILFC